MRQRSEATTIKYLRTVLRHARTALMVAKDPSASAEWRADFAKDVIRIIDRELAPKLRRGVRR